MALVIIIIDDGGDLTQILLDEYPHFVDSVKVYQRKLPLSS